MLRIIKGGRSETEPLVVADDETPEQAVDRKVRELAEKLKEILGVDVLWKVEGRGWVFKPSGGEKKEG